MVFSKNSAAAEAQHEQQDADGRKPAVVRGFLQADLEARQADDQEDQRQRVQRQEIPDARFFPRQEPRCGQGRDQARCDVDEKQPPPGIGLRDPAADGGADRGREHGHDARERCRGGMQPRRKQQEHRGEDHGNQHAAGEALQYTEGHERRESRAACASDRCQREDGDCRDEQPAQRERARQAPGQRNGNDLRDQVAGLDPAHDFRWNPDRTLDAGQRGYDDLDVEDRHEHAKAHQDEPSPCRRRAVRFPHVVGAHGAVCEASASARFSARTLTASTSAFSALKISATIGRCRASGSSAISPATTT